MSVIANSISLSELVQKSQFIVVAKFKKENISESNPLLNSDSFEVLEVLKESRSEEMPSLKVKNSILVFGAHSEISMAIIEQAKAGGVLPMPVVDVYSPRVGKAGDPLIVFLSLNGKYQFRYTADGSWESAKQKNKIQELIAKAKKSSN